MPLTPSSALQRRWHDRRSEAALAGELAQLRARVEILEQQVPDDVRSSGVSAYATRQGVRWRVAVPQPDGSVTTRRGYRTHEAACQARDCLTHLACPGGQASCSRFWRAWLAGKRAYLTVGALEDLETHGRKRLLPHLAHLPLGDITERHVRDWLNAMTEQHQAGAISAKTIDNARAALSSVLGDAARQDLLPRNPCRFVGPLPIEHRELACLRLRRDRSLPPRLPGSLPTARRVAHRDRRAHLRSARPHLARHRPRPRRRADPAPTRTTRRPHHPDQRQACPHGPDRAAPHRNAAHRPQHPPSERSPRLAIHLPATEPGPLHQPLTEQPAQP